MFGGEKMYYLPVVNKENIELHQLSLKPNFETETTLTKNSKDKQFISYETKDGTTKKFSLFGPDFLPRDIPYLLSNENQGTFFLLGSRGNYVLPKPSLTFERNVFSLLLSRFYYDMLYQTADPTDKDHFLELVSFSPFSNGLTPSVEILNLASAVPIPKNDLKSSVAHCFEYAEQYFSMFALLNTTLVDQSPLLRICSNDNQQSVTCINPALAPYVDLAHTNSEVLKVIETAYNEGVLYSGASEPFDEKGYEFTKKIRKGIR